MLIGVDILDIRKIEIIESKASILHRLFTPAELNSTIKMKYKKKIVTLASIFAAKEAVVKALGTGFTDDIDVRDIQIIIDSNRRGRVEFLAKAKELTDKMGMTKAHLALGAEKELIIAMVVIENKEDLLNQLQIMRGTSKS